MQSVSVVLKTDGSFCVTNDSKEAGSHNLEKWNGATGQVVRKSLGSQGLILVGLAMEQKQVHQFRLPLGIRSWC